jgi:hypothetical protein
MNLPTSVEERVKCHRQRLKAQSVLGILLNERKELKMDYLGYLMTISNLQDYVGKWIALVDKEIVASGDNCKTVFEQAKSKYPKKEPFIMKLPAETVMLL